MEVNRTHSEAMPCIERERKPHFISKPVLCHRQFRQCHKHRIQVAAEPWFIQWKFQSRQQGVSLRLGCHLGKKHFKESTPYCDSDGSTTP